MNCLACKNKLCKADQKDCTGTKIKIIEEYKKAHNQSIYLNADKLVANNKAGTLSRAEEIVLYAKNQSYHTIALAYCYGLEKLSSTIKDYFKKQGFKVLSFRCTINGIKESDISPDLRDSVNCNPIGQAEAINKSTAQLAVIIGLCLGHDIMLHNYLSIPFTTLIVKDRVFDHNPAQFFLHEKPVTEKFIEALDNKFNMRNSQWLSEQLSSDNPPFILDLRHPDEFEKQHIPGSTNIPLKSLSRQKNQLPGDKTTTIVALCNGGIQSAYAIVYLFSLGFTKVYNLSGGFGSWKKLQQ